MKYLKVIKRGLGKVVLVSEDGHKWVTLEQVYELDGDFKLEFGIKSVRSLAWTDE